jgi:hypothetical protein
VQKQIGGIYTLNNSFDDLSLSQKANMENKGSKQSPYHTANELVSLDDQEDDYLFKDSI